MVLFARWSHFRQMDMLKFWLDNISGNRERAHRHRKSAICGLVCVRKRNFGNCWINTCQVSYWFAVLIPNCTGHKLDWSLILQRKFKGVMPLVLRARRIQVNMWESLPEMYELKRSEQVPCSVLMIALLVSMPPCSVLRDSWKRGTKQPSHEPGVWSHFCFGRQICSWLDGTM